MLAILDSYDWEQAFIYVEPAKRVVTQANEEGFTREDVKRVVASVEGENDGPNWVLVGELNDGRFFCLSAGCDYTGWDCQASGSCEVADSEDAIIRYGVSDEERDRLGLPRLADMPQLTPTEERA